MQGAQGASRGRLWARFPCPPFSNIAQGFKTAWAEPAPHNALGTKNLPTLHLLFTLCLNLETQHHLIANGGQCVANTEV